MPHAGKTLGSQTPAVNICPAIELLLRTLVQADLDWPEVLWTARQHGVMLLLYRSLDTTCPEAVPPATLTQLRDHFYATTGRNAFLTRELLTLLRLLDAHEIAAIPYKGPVLAAFLYGNLALRELADLDILVDERTYPRAQQLLMAHGCRLTKELGWESTLVDASGRVAVDLHKNITPQEFPSPLLFADVSERLQRVALAGTEVPTLSPEDTLLMLAIQITKDAGSQYFQLVKICDMAELLRVYPRLDMAQALTHARRLGGERMLLVSLHLTHTLLGTALPHAVVNKRPYHPSLDRLMAYAQQHLVQEGNRPVPDQLTTAQFRWRVRERLRDKCYPYYLRYVRGTIVPCDLDRRLVPLPRHFSFLYYGIRPLRLVGKYGWLLFRRVIRSPRESR